MIAPHMAQNQRIESYVQMHAIVAKTDMKEVRRSTRSMLHSTIVWPFNQQSVEEKRSTIVNPKEREKVRQVKGQERIQMLGKCVHVLNSEIDSALVAISADLYDRVLLDGSSNKIKASAVGLKQQIEIYERGIKRKGNVTKSEENPNGMLVTPEMSGKMVLSALQIGKGCIDHVRFELDERGIEQPMPLEKRNGKR